MTRVGRDDHPVVIIDNFFPDPNKLREAAKRSSFVPALNLYPGIRAELPDCYWSRRQMQLLQTVIEREFSLRGEINLIDSSFSMVTTPRNQLEVGQRMPHPDAFRTNQIALIHYLSPDIDAGTAFYRHRSTGIETVTEDVRQRYFQRVDSELQQYGLPPLDYIDGDTQLFERIGGVAAKFNRALLYSGRQLHSGAINSQTPLLSDPSKGRLTITAFMTVD